ncbi:hypothetical protein BN940_04616 [Castellaniella defragrans 65Phen]|uniref:Uncharacterized protein n=1 Tax=Castellaniella defragrans (strain DSM 12143 / CCUG 39792 / 65Phen) TaxID=1437824 RepID=W8WV11_CASD6|nr:hypothetical protein BN940_04616 [Castellaniella defragrans 65Phen]
MIRRRGVLFWRQVLCQEAPRRAGGGLETRPWLADRGSPDNQYQNGAQWKALLFCRRAAPRQKAPAHYVFPGSHSP